MNWSFLNSALRADFIKTDNTFLIDILFLQFLKVLTNISDCVEHPIRSHVGARGAFVVDAKVKATR